ncbi:MAG: hypothetical protein J7L34_00615, partial [Thermotogaceae bacterium]|nr:hypothetical protein [Thermotogaceae bacterium]
MPGMRTHLLLGSLFYPVFYLIYFLILKVDPIDEYGINVVVTSYILFVIGSELPDIDADFAPIRYFVHALL